MRSEEHRCAGIPRARITQSRPPPMKRASVSHSAAAVRGLFAITAAAEGIWSEPWHSQPPPLPRGGKPMSDGRVGWWQRRWWQMRTAVAGQNALSYSTAVLCAQSVRRSRQAFGSE